VPARSQAACAPRLFEISVRELVEFVWRKGDLASENDFASPQRAWEGARGHHRVQQSRPPGYQAEVPVSHTLVTERFQLVIRGRLDGWMPELGGTWLEEIKTVRDRLPQTADPLHWAQLRCYAAMIKLQENDAALELRLTYLELQNNGIREFREASSRHQAVCFFEIAVQEYQSWLDQYCAWLDQRDASLRALSFPFDRYRPGQRQLAVAVYRALASQGRLFVEAPTGIGKTVSVLFPALKALGEQHCERLFYLTAKTPGRRAVDAALRQLRSRGLRLRSLALTAREKICVRQLEPTQTTSAEPIPENQLPGLSEQMAAPSPSGAPTQPATSRQPAACDARQCPFAIGFYDRIKAALSEALGMETLDQPALQRVALRHQVCPFELALAAACWVDLMVCDYNYVFDPQVSLKRLLTLKPVPSALMVDEAHNLLDRAREMFSAELDRCRLLEVKRRVADALPSVARALLAVNRAWSRWHAAHQNTGTSWRMTSDQLPQAVLEAMGRFLREAEAWLVCNQPAPFRDELRQCYFELLSFTRIAECFDERYVIISERPQQGGRLRLFCQDPSQLLRQAIPAHSGAVFFSGTLTPIDFYRDSLGGTAGDAQLRLPSPFPPEHLAVLVQDRIATTFKQRTASFVEVARLIAAFTEVRPGNYLVFFPSYEYLTQVRDAYLKDQPTTPLRVQNAGMTEAQRNEFLAAFSCGQYPRLIGFAVMGGVFGESIDLAGDQLRGAVIVGVGLPQICFERDLIRQHFDRRQKAGFDYAYRFPGINRVLQATGRVIRSETDRGALLLIDCRFNEPAYRRLLPDSWPLKRVRSVPEIQHALTQFWGATA
jgi:DNA excision repair protein ERCC-2